jgi:DNA-directed RNA polymerase
MLTESEIEAQYELERTAISCGLQRLHRNTYNVESKDYASASIYGIASVDTLIPLVVAEIKSTNWKIRKGNSGVAFKEIAAYLAGIEPLAAAAITCKIVFDKVFSFREDSSKLVNVCESIGTAVEQECQMRYYERECPELLEFLKKKYWHKASGTQQKFVNIRRAMNNSGFVWNTWGATIRVKLGNWLLDCVMNSSGWFTTQSTRVRLRTTVNVVPTAAFMDIKDEIMSNAELFSAIAWPMLIPPKEWKHDEAGGYLLNEVMCGHDMVRRGNQCPIQEETPYQFLNRIQGVGYKLNPFIVDVAEQLLELRRQVGRFVPVVELPLPPKPADIADNEESRHQYRRAAAEVLNINAAAFKQSCRTRMTMDAVKRFKNKEKFYLPWSFDYRGRAYPIPAFLTPQDTDFGKSLLKFADEAFMYPEAEEWLAFQVSTTYGLDKAPIEERLEWTVHHHELISRIVNDPIGTIPEWEAADEPWQFLAACEEYYHCCIVCDRQFTSLMIATDATCSGLQVLAGLARDKSTAQLVNVTPSDRPQDAYKVIAEEAKPYCPVSVQPYMDRKTTKRTVMTVPYNAKPFSNRSYIREALKEKGVEISKEDLTATVNAVRDAMYRVVPGPMAVMDWIEKEVREAFRRGATELVWTTPSGFTVTQRLMKKKVERLQLKLLGVVTQVKVGNGETDVIDVRHHCNATAPNLIHSLDASILHLSAIKFDAPLALIHDSVLCRATDMTSLSAIVRETYCYLFADHDYLSDWAKQIGATSEPPIIGTLKPENVLASTYFFC